MVLAWASFPRYNQISRVSEKYYSRVEKTPTSCCSQFGGKIFPYKYAFLLLLNYFLPYQEDFVKSNAISETESKIKVTIQSTHLSNMPTPEVVFTQTLCHENEFA